MKKLFIITACVILSFCSVSFADEVDDGLPQIASERIRASVRAMINMGIDGDDTLKMTRLMLNNRFREEHILRAHQIVMTARQQDLPLEPVTSKVNEGIAKQVSAEKIVQAMERVRSRFNSAYDQARIMTQDRSRVRDIGNTIAACMTAGMNEEDIERIMNRLQQRSRNMERSEALELGREIFITARDLSRLGLTSQETSDLLVLALKNQYTAREMVTMRNTFMKQSGTSSPAQVANNYTHSFRSGQDADGQDSETGGGSDGSGESGSDGSTSPGGSNGSGESGSGGSTSPSDSNGSGDSGSGGSTSPGGSNGSGDSGSGSSTSPSGSNGSGDSDSSGSGSDGGH
jgi:hypothetical protein